jgi:hypothetical protein
MEEEDFILLAQEQERLLKPTLESIRIAALQQYKRTNRYIRVEVDLSKAHTDEPLGLEGNKVTYLWVTIEQADSDFTYKLDRKENSPLIGTLGASFSQHEFHEIYVTNEVATGQAVLVVGWRE